MTTSVLPSNATRLERAVDIAIAKQIDAIKTKNIYAQWHPKKCPENLLGWLAWAVSVDDWNPDWSVQTKRDVIEASIDVHRHKGTKFGLMQALSSLDVSAKLIEYKESNALLSPFSFKVSIDRNESLTVNPNRVFNEEFYNDVISRITYNKPSRSQFDMNLNIAAESCVSAYSVISTTSVIMLTMSDAI